MDEGRKVNLFVQALRKRGKEGKQATGPLALVHIVVHTSEYRQWARVGESV